MIRPSADPSPPAPVPAAARPYRIVVLDDELELRNMLQRFLMAEGYEVRAVADSAKLDRLLAREAFDLLVLDLMMAHENGCPCAGACAPKGRPSRS